MPHLDANGERLHYREEGSGPAVLFIHSMGADGAMWRDQFAALADRYRCIAFDCRGHGASSYNDRFSVAGVAAELKAGLDALGVESCHLVGLAMGVPIAVCLAAGSPGAVRSATLVDGFLDMREAGGARIPEWSAAIRSTPMAAFGRRYVDSRLTESASQRARDDLAAAIARVPPQAYIDVMKAIFDGIAFVDEAAAIRAPALVIWGEDDEVTPLAHAQQIADTVPGARLETIPGAGHIANLDRPEAFNRLLADFLDAQPG